MTAEKGYKQWLDYLQSLASVEINEVQNTTKSNVDLITQSCPFNSEKQLGCDSHTAQKVRFPENKKGIAFWYT